MEHKAPYALVGLFVCLCVAALVGFTVWAQGNYTRDYTAYTVLMPDSVGGLDVGAQVQFRGINVGKVQKLRLPPPGDPNVRVDIRMRADVPVHPSTHAEIAHTSLTGIVSLNITAADEGDTAPPMRVADEVNPVIMGKKSPLESALKDVPAITHELRNLTGKANESLDDFRGSFVGKLMGQKDPDKKQTRPAPQKKAAPVQAPQYNH
jgi:phospholipid/cholesterol/gamma-HCH transport system substrate-binding protein